MSPVGGQPRVFQVIIVNVLVTLENNRYNNNQLTYISDNHFNWLSGKDVTQ
jgi:hypothetical protein